eukprot:CAMPEP_0172818924 /NCGR_PEP_ID=MMETSP1075-20121228/14228_1 /TAXON_ID=2916 /ORGANISM="Ceratium fusus, Strain PA161109" /LENGTH=34 /DNA_ID= /DNA_START= /DNA_END= /DNA_ORIENTATION=
MEQAAINHASVEPARMEAVAAAPPVAAAAAAAAA